MEEHNTSILITGGSGFIGSHLVIGLFNSGYTDIQIIDINDESEILKRYHKTLTEEDKEKFEDRVYHHMEGINPTFFDKNSFDLIIHLASPIGVDNIVNNSDETLLKANRINNIIIDHCFDNPHTKLIYSSSSEVYGNIKNGLITESSKFQLGSPIGNPRGSYAAQKIYMEYLVNTIPGSSTVVRFFNVVGPGQETPGMVFPTFFRRAMNKIDLTIMENGTRSYCHIEDCTRQLLSVVHELGRDTTSLKRNYNIGNYNTNNQISALDLAKKIIKVTDSTVEIKLNNDTKEFIPCRVLDHSTILNEDMTFRSLDRIIEDIHKWMKEEIER